MIVRPPTLRPVKQAVALFDRQVVDARDPLLHQAIRGKFPIFVAIAAEPPAIGVMPFIGETNGDAISVVRPEFLDEAVFQLALPLARQKGLDLVTASEDRPKRDIGGEPAAAVAAGSAPHRLRLANHVTPPCAPDRRREACECAWPSPRRSHW